MIINVDKIRNRIKTATLGSAKTPELVAVTKNRSEEEIAALIDANQRIFGENRVQEAQAHWAEKKREIKNIQLHLIGPLQSNKVKDAVALFDAIETLDRPSLIDALSAECKKQGKNPVFFIQVNIGQEEQKSGVMPEDLPDLLAYAASKGLKIDGLMCIPPAHEPAALYFALLKKLADRHGLEGRSMGMSGDFEKAIALGATHVRIGSALFGE